MIMDIEKLIHPLSDTPLWRKEILRHLLMAKLRAQNLMPALQRYGKGVQGWKGWYEWRGMPICFEDTEGALYFRW